MFLTFEILGRRGGEGGVGRMGREGEGNNI